MSDLRILSYEVAKHRLLREQLVAMCPEIDDDTLTDTLEGLTDLKDVLAEVIRSALVDEAMVAGLKGRIVEMRARLDRLEIRANRKRGLALFSMEKSKIEKVAEYDFTASLRSGARTLDITAEAEIPRQFWRQPPPQLDRHALLTALKAGAEVNGVALAPGKTQLAVRTL
jgi:phosphoglycerate dehydrogenase-like enzyme